MFKIKKSSQPNRSGIRTPYNALFVADLKKTASNTRWNAGEGVWFFDDFCLAAVVELAKKYFPEETKIYRVTWNLDDSCHAPSIDSSPLIWFGRDNWGKNNKTAYPTLYKEATFKTGGSRANPRLTGRLIIETKARPNAIFTPEPDEVTEL